MFTLDTYSQTLTLDTDYTLSEVEQELAKLGYSCGYFSPPQNSLRLKQALSELLPNLYALKYGELWDLCVAIDWESKSGNFLSTQKIPRQATGANWKNIVLGAKDELGLIYQATLKVFLRESEALLFLVALPDLETCYQLEREIRRHEMQPLVFGRFSYQDLKEVYGSLRGEYFLVLEWEGSEKFFNRLRAEWNHRVAAHTNYQEIERYDTQKLFSKLLRREYPRIPWGGLISQPSAPVLKEMKQKLAEGWN
ncbi:MAG: hypothetical protein HQM15_07800 [Deltaproteobacteria bacterium]|nr:hypothetical protein [Deltaproteobacteria bacterium]